MEFFIDTADVEAIRKANDMGFISGVTTNPTLIAKEGKDFHATGKQWYRHRQDKRRNYGN